MGFTFWFLIVFSALLVGVVMYVVSSMIRSGKQNLNAQRIKS
jgi:cbb3-type cytochrome oxidase subunit 3